MFYRNVYGRKTDSSYLTVPEFQGNKDVHMKIEFYYYIHSSGYQALELLELLALSGEYRQIWRSETVPPEIENAWIYACEDIMNQSEGKAQLSHDM